MSSETLSSKLASTLRDTRKWLEDCQELPTTVPRCDEAELQTLLERAKSEKSKATEHQRPHAGPVRIDALMDSVTKEEQASEEEEEEVEQELDMSG
eukprot:Skav225174  [mRNA]  locus=scaffold1095:302318:303632:- [translate_table: standard]